jgi:hypothetical protein
LFGGDKHFFAPEFFILNFNTLLQLTKTGSPVFFLIACRVSPLVKIGCRVTTLLVRSERKKFLQQSRLLNSANSRHPGARNRFGKDMTIERKIGGKEKSF